jgi:hypothetical protein
MDELEALKAQIHHLRETLDAGAAGSAAKKIA